MLDAGAENEREAFERGKREAFITAELDSHERRLNAINGSIERAVRGQTQLRGSIDGLRDQMEAMAAALDKKAAVEEERDRQRTVALKRASERQISNRTFIIGVVSIVVAILIPIVAALITRGGLL